MQAPWWWSKTETCRSAIYVYFNVNFNVLFKLIKVHSLVSELYMNRRCLSPPLPPKNCLYFKFLWSFIECDVLLYIERKYHVGNYVWFILIVELLGPKHVAVSIKLCCMWCNITKMLTRTAQKHTANFNGTSTCVCSCGLQFNVQGSVHRKCIPVYIQQDATFRSLFISGNCSTCIGWYLHPSSGAHTTVYTASGTCQTVTATQQRFDKYQIL